MSDWICNAIVGKSGYGKSYYFVNEMLKKRTGNMPVLIIDKKAEYHEQLEAAKINDYMLCKDESEFISKIRKGFKNKIVLFYPKKSVGYWIALDLIISMSRPVWLVLEEAHTVVKGTDKESYGKLFDIVRFGRSKNKNITLISQRLSDIPPDLRTQMRQIITFKQTYKSDLKTLDELGSTGSNKVFDFDVGEYEIITV